MGKSATSDNKPVPDDASSVSLKKPTCSACAAPRLTNVILMLIAAALFAIAIRPISPVIPVEAGSIPEHRLFIEPGIQVLRTSDLSRNVYGRVVIDLSTGNVWGFPTPAGDPYPFQPLNHKPETSHPFLLGRFAFEDINR